ncbi:AP2/ERF and B3 domain-containing transcription factor At1g51120-like [Vigna unguiculata]|uniref:RAV-like factor n=1 Tax=Vigna unguiculata TaxID=3917 RepID=A0A4D6MYD2_VIGUN|nr:AP2/ERF and B3 domain-containing transcription factor At1g51120-like [Vigna unguiculata]QCE05681.1 RAV-like factor [Vigna unguiculata]
MTNRNREGYSDCSEINFAAAFGAMQEDNNAAGALVQKFKGVVPQQNGNWGAQIYANHQRIWLGTFKSEREAAMAYDSASIKLRSGDSHRNFPWNDQTVQEPQFQSHYSTARMLSMIRDGTYPSHFATFLRTRETQQGGVPKHVTLKGHGTEQLCCTQLFQKELTPSDVGKLNRLVIPKKHAVTYFPNVCDGGAESHEENGSVVDVEVAFYDRLMRLWKFRYCYWKSSQSYVFTRGWNRFVKDKKLKAKDTIAFFMCEPVDCRTGEGREAFGLIDVIYNSEERGFGDMICSEEDEETKDENTEKGLRLFGVFIK